MTYYPRHEHITKSPVASKRMAGIYLCRIELGAQAGEDDAVRLISLAY